MSAHCLQAPTSLATLPTRPKAEEDTGWRERFPVEVVEFMEFLVEIWKRPLSCVFLNIFLRLRLLSLLIFH